MELCGMESIDLIKNSVKILGIHFYYNKKIENEENLIKLIMKIENILKILRTRNLTVQSIISRIIHLVLVTNVPHINIDQLNKIQIDFIWNQKHPKKDILSFLILTRTVILKVLISQIIQLVYNAP